MSRLPAFRKLAAREQLAVNRRYPRLIPLLLGWGLSAADALALAHNATLLFYAVEADPPLSSSMEVLERYSLEEIAALCEAYRQVAAGELAYGRGEVAP